VVGEIPFLGIGGWSWSVLALYLVSIWMIARSQGRYPWHPDGKGWHQHPGEKRQSVQQGRRKSDDDHKPPLGWTIAKTITAGAAILVAGFLLSRTGEAIAEKTGLGSSFVGAVFVAISTSLPEVSTVLSAVRLRRYLMAVSDIFGTNLFDVGLVFLVDATYGGGPVLNEVGRFSSFAALVGIVVTTLYIVGLIERRNRTILRMGVDSLIVLVAYLGGLILLYQLR
jgi:cation:H+ antiporter